MQKRIVAHHQLLVRTAEAASSSLHASARAGPSSIPAAASWKAGLPRFASSRTVRVSSSRPHEPAPALLQCSQCQQIWRTPRHPSLASFDSQSSAFRPRSPAILVNSLHNRHLSTSIARRRELQQAGDQRSSRNERNAATKEDQDNETSSSSNKSGDSSEPDQIPLKPSDVSIGEVKRLLTLAKPEKKTLGIALGLLAVSSAVSLSVPFTLGRIIDLFTSPSTSSLPVSLPVAATIIAAVFATGALANTGRSILMRIAGQRIVKRLREDAYNNTLKLDMAKFDLMGTNVTPLGDEKKVTMDRTEESRRSQESQALVSEKEQADSGKSEKVGSSKAASQSAGSRLSAALSLSNTSETTPDVGVRGVGDIISRLGSDASIVGESLTRELSEGLRALATVFVGAGMMIWISAKLTAVMLCIVPPTAIGAVFYGRYLKKLSRRTQKKVGELIAVAEERLSSVRTVQAFNAVEPLETKRYSKKATEILDLAKKEAYASGLFYGGAGFSGNITMLALLSYGGKLVSQGEITVGDLSSLMLYTAYVGSSLFSLTSFFSTIMKGLGAAARVFELLDAKPTSVTLGQGIKLPASTPARPVTFDNVHFSYPSRPEAPILRGVTFTIPRGRSIALAGGSGSGKSTVVNLLERYYDPIEGRVLFGDEDIRTFTPESWRERVSIVPQDPALFSQTIAENIAYGKPDATMSEIREAARLANCDFIDELPLGFDTPVGAKAAQLSGGQRQRLAIARALVRQPSILILDEATSALDAASESLVNQAVKRINSSHRITTILVAHRLSTLKTADEIIFMKDGRVAERGTYDELTRGHTQFMEMIRSQMLGTTSSVEDTQDAIRDDDQKAER